MSIPISEGFILHQIAAGKRLIDQHSVIFFDVFDTLITRDCAKPADVFSLMEQCYNAEHADAPLRDFPNRRLQAERRCAQSVTAATLEEIYQCFPLDDVQRVELLSLEQNTERAVSTRKYTGYALYCYAKAQGKAIVAVSDMYLPSSAIKDMLTAAGYEIDTVIVSCEHRAEKYDGRLFRIALSQLGVWKKEVVHFGDNPVSDILGAARAGIDCLWLPARKHLCYFKKCGETFSDRYLIPFVANRVALLDNKAEALGYETCGPMLVGFCQWLHEKLHAGRFDRALFCARDMKQTMEIYLRMYPEDQELVRYFYASRKSLTPPYQAATGVDTSSDAAQQLAYLRAYLHQLGCRGKVALVDSGLNGRSQKMLYAIIGSACELHGFYIRISRVFHKNVQDIGTCVYMYPDQPEIGHMISSMFFETMIAATHGRTISYRNTAEGIIEPVLGGEHPEAKRILEYQKGANLFAKNYAGSPFQNNRIVSEAVCAVMLQLAFSPKKDAVAYLRNLKCGNEKYEPLLFCRRRSYYCLHPMAILRDLKNTYWKGGFLRECFSSFAPLVSKVYLWADRLILSQIGEWKDPREPE